MAQSKEKQQTQETSASWLSSVLRVGALALLGSLIFFDLGKGKH